MVCCSRATYYGIYHTTVLGARAYIHRFNGLTPELVIRNTRLREIDEKKPPRQDRRKAKEEFLQGGGPRGSLWV